MYRNKFASKKFLKYHYCMIVIVRFMNVNKIMI